MSWSTIGRSMSQVISSLALASEETAVAILTDRILAALISKLKSSTDEVRCTALVTLSNLAFPVPNKRTMLSKDGFLDMVIDLASPAGGESDQVCRRRRQSLLKSCQRPCSQHVLDDVLDHFDRQVVPFILTQGICAGTPRGGSRSRGSREKLGSRRCNRKGATARTRTKDSVLGRRRYEGLPICAT
jgi:hypothetical protein